MICRQINDGPCKTYLLVSAKTKEAILIDPLLEKTAEYLEILQKEKLRLTHVVDTHTHADHLSGCVDLRDRTSAAYVMHTKTKTSDVTQRTQDGETLGVGEIKMTFLHTPGHTTDSVSLLLNDRILSGDFLFIGSSGAGRLDLPGSDPGTHFDSLKKIDALSNDLLVMPGHDYQGAAQSSLGVERKANPILSPRSREAYIRWWSQKQLEPADWMKDVVKANLLGARDPAKVFIPQGVAACCAAGPAANDEPHPQISAKDLARKLHQAPGSAVLLDVRTTEEYTDELGHIAGTILISIDDLEDRIDEVPLGEIVAICRSGKRATRAASILKKAGHVRIWVLTGGMLAWNKEHLLVA